MRDSSDFVNKYIQVVTKAEAEITGTLISIESNGLLLEEEIDDRKINYFIPSNSVDYLQFDPTGDY